MSSFQDFGPFAGMTYAGRQLAESTVKQAASLAKTALVRASERRKDTLPRENIVGAGRLAYADAWTLVRSGRLPTLAFLTAAVLFVATGAMVLGLGVTECIDLSRHLGTPTLGDKIGVLLFSSICAVGAAGAAIYIVSDLRHGCGTAYAKFHFARTARHIWGIGDKALYIVDKEDERAKTTTVFYDAVGTVDLDQNDDGIDVITLRSRDGSFISEFVDPVTSATSNAKVIADAITARIAAVNR
jgi:hypothetical protein